MSIVVPIYNGERYLKECVESLINQTYEEIEIILIDDGSTDQSIKICHEYANKDERVIVCHNSNRGVSYSRNYGVKKSTGKYITFVDCDDYLGKDAIETMVQGFSSNNVNLIITGCNDIIEGELKKRLYDSKVPGIKDKNQIIETYIRQGNSLILNVPWNKMYLSKIIKSNNILFNEDIDLGEDLLFNLEYCSYIVNANIINKQTYNYRILNNGLTMKKRPINFYWKNNNFMLEYFIRLVKNKTIHLDELVVQKHCFSTFLYTLKEVSNSEIYYSKKIVKNELKQICTDFKKKYVVSYKNIEGIKQKLYYKAIYKNCYELLYLMLKYIRRRSNKLVSKEKK